MPTGAAVPCCALLWACCGPAVPGPLPHLEQPGPEVLVHKDVKAQQLQ